MDEHYIAIHNIVKTNEKKGKEDFTGYFPL